MCILTTTHYACTCTFRSVQKCGASSFACEHTFQSLNLYHSCPDCELDLYRAIESFATKVTPPKAPPPVLYQTRKPRPAIQGESQNDKPKPQSPGAIVQPPSPFWDRDWPLGTLTQGSFCPPLGWDNTERTRQRREAAEVVNNTQDGLIIPSHKDAHLAPLVEVAPSLIDAKSVFPQPLRNYHSSISTLMDPGSVTLIPSSAFADMFPPSNSMKRKRSSEYNPDADLEILGRPNRPFLPPLVITPPYIFSDPVAERSSPLTPLGPTPRTPHAFADVVAHERSQKAESRKRKRVSVPYSPHNDDPESNSPFSWCDLPSPGPSPTKACKRHEGSRMDGAGNRNCDACRKATSGLVVYHLKAEELEEDVTRADMKKKAGWRGWVPVEEIPSGEFERLPKFDRRGVPIQDSTDAPILRSEPLKRQTRSQARRQRRD